MPLSRSCRARARPVGDTPEQFRAFIDSETKKWAKVIKDAGVHTEK